MAPGSWNADRLLTRVWVSSGGGTVRGTYRAKTRPDLRSTGGLQERSHYPLVLPRPQDRASPDEASALFAGVQRAPRQGLRDPRALPGDQVDVGRSWQHLAETRR